MSPPAAPPPRIAHVSDTHFAPDSPHADQHWAAVTAYVTATRPDLVVHTGDVTLDGHADPAQLAYARERLAALPVPWLVLPGNHDVGDAGDPRHPLDGDRRARWAEVFGTDRWSHRIGGWRLVGVDVQTLADHRPESAELADWLVSELSAPGPTALFLHRPLWPWGEADDEPRRYVGEPLRARLAGLLARGVRLVGSGHVHQFLTHDDDGVHHVWAPSTWALLPDHIQPVIGDKRTGLVEHVLAGDGTVTSTFVQPPGMADLVIGRDFPSPYDH
jgi:3',5'-cyclic AMP phosphodiesterase CpdA